MSLGQTKVNTDLPFHAGPGGGQASGHEGEGEGV